MYGDTVPEKRYTTSLSNYPVALYAQEGIEEQIKDKFVTSLADYNDEAVLGIYNWPELIKWFYKWKLTFNSKHRVFYKQRIVSIVDVEVE